MKTLYGLSLSPQRMSRAYYESLEQGGTVCGIPRVCAQSDHQPHDIGQGPFLIASPDQKWVQLPVKGARGRELENREEIHQMAVVSMGQEMGRLQALQGTLCPPQKYHHPIQLTNRCAAGSPIGGTEGIEDARVFFSNHLRR